MSAAFHILGPLQVYAGGRIVAVGGPKERALLALMLVHPNRVLSVDRLTEELWGDAAPGRATAALRVYVSHLRRALGAEGDDVIATRAPGYLLRLAPEQLDATLFETLATEGHAHLRGGAAELAAVRLRDALALWRGPALADVADLGFARPEIGRLEELRLGAIEGRVEADLACGRHGELVGELGALVGEHPLRERLWASRILALYRSGRQAEALAAYQEVRRILGEQVGLDPGPALVALERAVLARDPSLDWAPVAANGHLAVMAAAPPVVEPSRLPLPAAVVGMDASTFVGRGTERSHLESAFARARAGDRQVVLVAGEPGMGKTALAARVASGLWSEGAIVLFGRCDEESLVPFQPFVEVLAHYVEHTSPEHLRRLLGDRAADLALLLPELCRRLPELEGTGATGADTERYRLLESVPTLLRAVGAEAPIALLLDDLHWADRPTLQLLQHLIRRTVGVPLLVLGTYRDTDLVRTHPMAQTLAEFRRANLVDRVLLRGLGEDDVAALIGPGGELTPAQRALAAALWRQTEGSPLFLRETLRHLAETAVVRREEDGRWEPRRRIEQLGIPEGVKEVIGRRLTRLSEVANAALRTGSVMGRSFRLDVLEAVTDHGADALLDAMEEALAAGIVTEVAGTPGRYSFTHALVRDALYDELSLTRRVRMHHRVAEALEALVAADPGPHLAELAYHFSQAATAAGPDRAIDYARQAGLRARRLSAYEDAVRHFAMALEVAEDAGVEPGVRADLLLDMGRAQWQLGDARPARATYERVVALVGDSDPRRLARAAMGYAGAGTQRLFLDIGSLNTRAIGLVERALAGLPETDSTLRARLLARLAALQYFDAATERRRAELSAEAVAMARRLGHPWTLANTLSDETLAIWGPDNIAALLANADEMHAIARELGSTELETLASGSRTMFFAALGDVPAYLRAIEETERLVDETRNLVGRQYCRISRANLLALQGRFDEAEALVHLAFRDGTEARDTNAFHLFTLIIVVLRLLQGRASEVVHIPVMGADLVPLMSAPMRAIAASMFSSIGMDHQSRRYLEAIDLEDPVSMPRNAAWVWTAAHLVLACGRLGDRDRAATLHRLLRPHAGTPVAMGGPGLGPCDTFLGIAAATAGMHDEAERHFEDAAATAARHGWHVIVAQVEAHHATMLVERGGVGDRQRAQEMAARAAAAARVLGLGGVADAAAGVLERVAGGTARRPAATATRVTRRDRLRARMTTGGRAAVALVSRGQPDRHLLHLFGSSLAQRALLTAVAAAFRPSMALGFEGAIVFELLPATSGPGPDVSDWWTIEVRDGAASLHHRRDADPAVTLRLGVADLVRLVSGELDPLTAIVDWRVIVDGDVLVASRLTEMFGTVEPLGLPALSDSR